MMQRGLGKRTAGGPGTARRATGEKLAHHAGSRSGSRSKLPGETIAAAGGGDGVREAPGTQGGWRRGRRGGGIWKVVTGGRVCFVRGVLLRSS